MELLIALIILINKGGVISWVITVLYFFVFAVCVERTFFFFRTRSRFETIKTILQWAIEKKKFVFFLEHPTIKKHRRAQAVRMITHFIENKERPPEAFNEALEREGFIAVEEMEKNIWLLSQIGHIAPLLGLLGTVVGLITTFQIIASLGAEADVASFSAGIWEAMITTANGLIVAIPSFFLYRIFEKIVERRSNEMTRAISILNETYANGHTIPYAEGMTMDEKDEPHEMV